MKETKTLKVKCFITGEETTFSGDYLKKLIETYGSRENIQKYFINYKSKNLFFKGHSVSEIRKLIVLKSTKLPDENSEEGLEIIKYWQDFKQKNNKFNKKQTESISFNKTDEDVTVFLDEWKKYKNNE